MNISGVAQSQSTGNQSIEKKEATADAYIKSLQTQIEAAKKKIEDLNKNDSLDSKTKQTQKEALEKTISDLQKQISDYKLQQQQKAMREAVEKKEEQIEQNTKMSKSEYERRFDRYTRDTTRALVGMATAVKQGDSMKPAYNEAMNEARRSVAAAPLGSPERQGKVHSDKANTILGKMTEKYGEANEYADKLTDIKNNIDVGETDDDRDDDGIKDEIDNDERLSGVEFEDSDEKTNEATSTDETENSDE